MIDKVDQPVVNAVNADVQSNDCRVQLHPAIVANIVDDIVAIVAIVATSNNTLPPAYS